MPYAPWWFTRHEIAFASRLGTGKNFPSKKWHTQELSRLEILRRYRRTLDFRVKWGKIEKQSVVEFVDKLIGHLGGAVPPSHPTAGMPPSP